VCKTRCAECPAPRLLPDCQPGVVAYQVCATQWRQGFAGRTGLDYPACIATLQLYLPRWQQAEAGQGGGAFGALEVGDLMEQVQCIEVAMLEADEERRERDRAAKGSA
jgi:hypothetical protein